MECIFAILILIFIFTFLTVFFVIIVIVTRVEFIHVGIRPNDAVEE